MTAWDAAVRSMVGSQGIALRQDLRDLGVTQQTLRRRLAGGLLVEVNRSVVALPGTTLDLATRTRAAVLMRPDTVPTGMSVAALLVDGPWDELPLDGDPWLVGRPDRALAARFLSHPGLVTVRRDGLIIAHPMSAVVDLLRFLGPDAAADVGRRALQQRAVTLDQLLQAHAQLTGHRGMRQLAAIIEELVEGTHSQAEHELVSVLRQARVTGWIANFPVRIGGRRYFIDVAFPEGRLAVEVDGRAHHSDARAFQRDRQRQNDLVAAGWTVLRFTWDDLVRRPGEVIDRIVAALVRATAV